MFKSILIRCVKCQISNAKYLLFDTPNTTIQTSSAVLNVSKIWNMLQYHLKYEMVGTTMPIFFIICLFTGFSLSYFTQTFSLSFISSFLSASEFFSLADLAKAANLTADLTKAVDLARAIVVLHNSLFTLILFLSHPRAAWSRSRLKPPQAVEIDLAWSCLKPILSLTSPAWSRSRRLSCGFVWFGMSFEVCECGGLWVSCGSSTVVIAAIWWLWWWLMIC